jgi:protein-S-isoprenylcysteine O-methyltransferase Ste14
MLGIFIIPALDRRFGWTPFSWVIIIVGICVFIPGYVALMAEFSANRYAARTVKVQEGQKVIDTGPYAIVRHPMYALVPLIYAGIPLILNRPGGSSPCRSSSSSSSPASATRKRFSRKDCPATRNT